MTSTPGSGMPLYTPIPLDARIPLALRNDLSDLQYWFYMGGFYSAAGRLGAMREEDILEGQNLAHLAILRSLDTFRQKFQVPQAENLTPPEWFPLAIDGIKTRLTGRGRIDIRYSNGSLRTNQPASTLRYSWGLGGHAYLPTHWRPHKPKKDTP